jgi:hypothetical protein
MEALFPAVLIALVGIPVVLAIARHAQNLDSNMGPAAWGAFTRVRFTAGRPRRIVCRMGRTLAVLGSDGTGRALITQDGQIYVLPLSERGAARVWAVISDWRRARDLLSGQESQR